MKKRIVSALVMAAGLIMASSAGATFIDNNTNLSAEWTRMSARVGSADSMDAIVYNPAGTTKLADGVYAMISNQFLPKEYKHTAGGIEHKTTTLTTLVPGFFALKKSNNWSGFAGATVIGGGGTLEYDNGTVSSKAHNKTVTELLAVLRPTGPEEEVTSVYMGAYIGGAYAFNDKISLSLIGRMVYGINEMKGDGGDFLDYEKTATGYAPIIGLNYSPSESLNIGFRHEFRTKLEWEVDKNEGSASTLLAPGIGAEGDKSRRDFPALTALGVAWMATDALKLAADISYVWHDEVNWEGAEKNLDNGYEASLGIEYALKPTFKVSAGYSYEDSGMDVDDYSTFIGKMPYHAIATGFMIEPVTGLQLNVGVTKMFYDTKTDSNDIKYEKDIWIIGIGTQYKFR